MKDIFWVSVTGIFFATTGSAQQYTQGQVVDGFTLVNPKCAVASALPCWASLVDVRFDDTAEVARRPVATIIEANPGIEKFIIKRGKI